MHEDALNRGIYVELTLLLRGKGDWLSNFRRYDVGVINAFQKGKLLLFGLLYYMNK